MDIDGGNPKPLTSDGGSFPSCSPDGKWVAYTLFASGSSGIFRMPMHGADGVRMTNENEVACRPVVSPDGKLGACNYIPPGSDWQLRIATISFEDSRPAHVFDILTIDVWRELRWTADGRVLTYIETRQGVSNLWSQPLDGGKPAQVTDFKSDLIFSWDWSRDGRLACARGTQNF